MLRGAQKQMIVIRTHDSRPFEEAYFVVRKPRTGRPACKEDMLWEANRIIERSLAAAAPAGGTDTGTAPADGDERIAGAGNTAAHRQPAGRHLPFLRRQGIVRGLWFLLGVLCGGGAVSLLHLLP